MKAAKSGLVMLDQFLGKLDVKIYSTWQKNADAVLKEIAQGLSKIVAPSVPELEALQKSLPLDTSQPRAEYSRALQAIQEKIIFLATQKDFHHSDVNDFFFHAYRSLNNLTSFMTTKAAAYGEAFFNPSRRQSESEEQPHPKKIALSIAANFTRDALLDTFSDDIAFLHLHVEKLPPHTQLEKVEDRPPSSPPLASMGLHLSQTEKLNPTPTLDSPQAVFPFLTENIYAFGFDSYYMHVARLWEAQDKVEKIIAEKEKTLEDFQKMKEAELAKLGLSSLATPQTRLYLDNIARDLGFESATALYDNYRQAAQEEHFNAFKAKRERFIDFVHQPSSRESDPLEKIKSHASQEYQRAKTLPPHKENATYLTLMAYYGNDNVVNIEVKQRLNNLGRMASQDYLPQFLSHLPSYAAPLAKLTSWLINVPRRLSTQFLGDLYTEHDLLQKRLNNACAPLNQSWIDFNQSKMDEHRKNAIHFFEQIKDNPREKIIDKLVKKQMAVQKAKIEIEEIERALRQASPQTRSHLESRLIIAKETYQADQSNYLTFKALFDYETDRTLWETPFEKLENVYLADLNEERDRYLLAAEQALKRKENAYYEKESTLMGRIIQLRDKLAAFLGIETETATERRETLLRFEEEKTKINVTEDVYKERSRAVSKQKALYKQLTYTSSFDLADKIITLSEEYLNVYNQIQHHDDPSNLQKLYDLNKQILSLENQINMSIALFMEKSSSETEIHLNSLETQALLARIQEVRALLSRALPKEYPLLARFQSMENQLEKMLLEHTRRKQADRLKSMQSQFDERFDALPLSEIRNPFHLVSTEEMEVKVPLYEHIAARYGKKLETEASGLTIKQLEDLLYTFKQGYYYHTYQEPAEHKKMAPLYGDLSEKVEKHLEREYQKLQQTSLQEQQSMLEALDADFIHHMDTLSEKEGVHNYAQLTYHAVWNIGYFFCSQYTLIETQSALAAARDQQLLFTKHYKDFLSRYDEKAFTSLPPAALSAHIARLEAHLKEIVQLVGDSKDPQLQEILFRYNAILQSAKQAKEKESSILVLEGACTVFSKKLEEMQDEVRDHKSFDIEKYNRIKEGMRNTLETLKNKNRALQEAEKEKYAALLDRLIAEIDSLNARFEPSFQFYEKIAKNQPQPIPPLGTEYLGNGLVLAVQAKNEEAIEQLLSLPDVTLPVQDLAIASRLAASAGHFRMLEKIHQHRKDIAFTQSHLFESIKAALNVNHPDIAYYLILELSYEPNIESSEFLQGHLPLPHSTLSPIPRSMMQRLIDNDGPALEQLRQCFMCEEALLKAMPLAIEKLEKAIKIREKMVSFLDNRVLDNPDRKKEALTQWHSEIAALENAYRQKVAPAPLPPSAEQEDIPAEKDSAVAFDEAKTKLMHVIEDKKWTPSALHAALSHLRHLTQDGNKESFYHALSEAINYAARHNKDEALEILLVQIEDPTYKKELASNALFEALLQGQIHTTELLVSQQAFEGKESKFIEELFKIQQEKENGQNQTRHTCFAQLGELFLSHMSVAFDGRVKKMIHQLTDKKEASSALPPVEQGFFQWARDNDYPFLEEIRETYLFSEKVLQDTSMKMYVRLRSPFDQKLGEKELKDFSPEEIKAFEIQHQAAVAELKHQEEVLKNLRNYGIDGTRQTIENEERMQKHVKRWEQRLAHIINNIEDDLAYIEQHIHAYHQKTAHPEPIVFSHRKNDKQVREETPPLPPHSDTKQENPGRPRHRGPHS